MAIMVYNEYMMLLMNSFWSRVEDLYNEDLNQSWLSHETGIKQSTISGWKRKDRLPPADRAALIARALGVSVEYLVFGEDTEDTSSLVLTSYENLEDPISIPSQKAVTLSTGQKVLNIPFREQPVSVCHGEPIAEQYTPEKVFPVLECLVAHYDRKMLKVIKVKGDSMIGAQLYGGDFVIFAEAHIEGDGIYVISINGEALVKRLEFDQLNNQVVVHSENKKYVPKTISADSEMMRIEGKVVGWYHNHLF